MSTTHSLGRTPLAGMVQLRHDLRLVHVAHATWTGNGYAYVFHLLPPGVYQVELVGRYSGSAAVTVEAGGQARADLQGALQ